MARVRFTRDYDHRWSSRAMTHFRKDGGAEGDGVYTVKREVADAAVATGAATLVGDDATAEPGGKAQHRQARGVVGRDPAPDRDHARRDELESDGGRRLPAELSGDDGA